MSIGIQRVFTYLALYCLLYLQAFNLWVLGCWVWLYMAEDFEDNRNQFQVSERKRQFIAYQMIEGQSIPFNTHNPRYGWGPWEKKKKIKVPTKTPLRKKPSFVLGHFVLYPSEKMARSKDADWLTPSEMSLVTLLRKSHPQGGGWILNGMALINIILKAGSRGKDSGNFSWNANWKGRFGSFGRNVSFRNLPLHFWQTGCLP